LQVEARSGMEIVSPVQLGKAPATSGSDADVAQVLTGGKLLSGYLGKGHTHPPGQQLAF
jgi:hypothetical protein